MAQISAARKALLAIPAALGAAAAVTGMFALTAAAVAALFVLLALMKELRGQWYVYVFFFTALICLPTDAVLMIRLIGLLFEELSGLMKVCLGVTFTAAMLSIETIAAGIAGYLLWREQDETYAEKKKKAEEGEKLGHWYIN